MKTAIYIESGLTQIVLTPETPWETNVVSKLGLNTAEVKLHAGQFYACQGGWTRHGDTQDPSLIIVLNPPAE
jgi:hypothetical protein